MNRYRGWFSSWRTSTVVEPDERTTKRSVSEERTTERSVSLDLEDDFDNLEDKEKAKPHLSPYTPFVCLMGLHRMKDSSKESVDTRGNQVQRSENKQCQRNISPFSSERETDAAQKSGWRERRMTADFFFLVGSAYHISGGKSARLIVGVTLSAQPTFSAKPASFRPGWMKICSVKAKSN
jgi:hypothetical protein